MTTLSDPATQHPQFAIRLIDHRSRTSDASSAATWDEEDDLLPDDQGPPARLPTSARRYGASPYDQKTRPQTQALARPRRASMREEAPARQPTVTRPRGRLWFTLIVGMLAMGALLAIVNAAIGWVQAKQLDWTYGYPRTFQTDAVVGHEHDSATHPSHFIALNLHGQVEVIELPAGDPAHVHLYLGPSVTDESLPVTLSFADVDHDGTPDLVIHVGQSVMVLLNNGHDDQFHASTPS